MKTTMMIFGLLFTLALISQTECFTAGIGNVGKRQLTKVDNFFSQSKIDLKNFVILWKQIWYEFLS